MISETDQPSAADGALACSPADLDRAAEVLDGVAHRTPILTSAQFDRRVDANVYFKCENFQRGGAFKFRGAYNAIANLPKDVRSRGVLAFSSGNHAQAVALSAQLFGIDATIVMPLDSPKAKVEATLGYGATVVSYDRFQENREIIAAKLVAESGAALIPPFNHPDVIAGQGTAARELFVDVGPLDALYVCVGGGGLIAGSAIASNAAAPKCAVIGVEPEAGNDGAQSLARGSIVTIDPPSTIADGARTQALGALTFPIMQRYVDAMETVSDAQLTETMRFFAERMKIVVEPTGCLGAAALLYGKKVHTGKRIGVIISGGNLDLS